MMNQKRKTGSLFPVQMKLNFGQQRTGSTRCSTCGMVYTTGDKQDEKLHTTYHRRMLPQAVKLPRGRHQRILEEHFDGTRIAELLLTDRLGVASFLRITVLIDRFLGPDNPQTISPDESKTSLNTVIPKDWRVFVCVKDGNQQVIGCAVVQELTPKVIIAKGYQVQPLKGGRPSLLTWRLQDSKEENLFEPGEHPEPEPLNKYSVLCGVRRIWVDENHRRKGVASRLLDCVLASLIYGHPLKRTQVAFTDMTADGANFATSFVGREQIFIY
ncbi:hypothetical protein PHET_09549 [Paragonimus heterotremus]|uniref:Uncharacterized protein n=1 Tax=Paragonimus heterotremus TaxID=100268 RepID=A0A8J4WES1_9TREM|nr:hypothetical protein PHET_09549 [Paragonimus heterotremus]